MLQDLTYQAYVRAHQAHPEIWPALPDGRYKYLFEIHTPDVTKTDNTLLATATENLSNAFDSLQQHYPNSPTLRRTLLRLLMKFAGEPQDDEVLDQIMREAGQPQEEETADQLSVLTKRMNGNGRSFKEM